MEIEVERVEETNPTTSEMESILSKIQMVAEATQCLKQGLGSFDRATILECVQTLEDLTEKAYHVGAPKTTNDADGGSINRNQQISSKRGATIDISQELIGSSPNTSKSCGGKLQRGASRARRRLPICDHEKVRCLRCDGLTLTSRDSNVTYCQNCGCILPSFLHEP